MRLPIFALILALFNLYQTPAICERFDKKEISKRVDEYILKYSYNKIIPKELEFQALVALSYYPELKNTVISFRYQDIKTTMETRPTVISSLIGSEREYIIYVDNKRKDKFGILLDEVPFNAQIGLIGHELAHIKYYESKTNYEIIKIGVKYGNDEPFKIDFERMTDLMTIEQGLGFQLYDWAYYVLNSSTADESYKEYKKKFYLTPKEIKNQMNKNSKYKMKNRKRIEVDSTSKCNFVIYKVIKNFEWLFVI